MTCRFAFNGGTAHFGDWAWVVFGAAPAAGAASALGLKRFVRGAAVVMPGTAEYVGTAVAAFAAPEGRAGAKTLPVFVPNTAGADFRPSESAPSRASPSSDDAAAPRT